MSSKVVRVGLPSTGFQATLPSFMATRVPSLVVKLRTMVRCCILCMSRWRYSLVMHTPRAEGESEVDVGNRMLACVCFAGRNQYMSSFLFSFFHLR